MPYIPADLISEQCLERILSVTDDLPAALGIGPFMFECSLDSRPVADFAVAVIPSRGDLHAFSRFESTGDPTPPDDKPDWTGISRFARSAMDASTSLSSTIEQVWLEFDVCLTREGPGNTPSVFLSLGYESSGDPSLRRTLAGEYVHVAQEALGSLQGRRTSPTTLSTLAHCFSALPAGAHILFIGAMTSRDTEDIRVVASGLSLEAMVRYVQRLGLEKPMGSLALIAEISDLTDHMWLAIDVAKNRVAPRVGFDCYCTGIDETETNRRWAHLLDLLVDKGICTTRKRNALLDATDMSSCAFDELTWPEDLRKVSTVLGPAGFDRMGLSIHHIKVIDRPGMPLEAKAYLCGTYR
jgi:hypothetical protein